MYELKLSKKVVKKLNKFDGQTSKLIYSWMMNNLYKCEDPRLIGKALRGQDSDYWRYRVGAYRIIVEIKDEELIILAIDVDHRKNIYE